MATLEKQIGSRSGDKKPGEIGSRRSPLPMQSYTMGPPLIHEGSEPVGPESKAYGHTVRQRGSRVVGRAEWFMGRFGPPQALSAFLPFDCLQR